MKSSLNRSPVKVICESCVQAVDYDCALCSGQRFYLWDPNSLECFAGDGTPLLAVTESGEAVPVTRSMAAPARIDLKSMLDFIELWVLETPVRKWKLVLDEEGWHACVWFNRYKKTCFETGGKDLEECISRSYREIVNRKK